MPKKMRGVSYKNGDIAEEDELYEREVWREKWYWRKINV